MDENNTLINDNFESSQSMPNIVEGDDFVETQKKNESALGKLNELLQIKNFYLQKLLNRKKNHQYVWINCSKCTNFFFFLFHFFIGCKINFLILFLSFFIKKMITINIKKNR